jgi:hypothetical protein
MKTATVLLFVVLSPSLFAGVIHDDCRQDGSTLNRIFVEGYVGAVIRFEE